MTTSIPTKTPISLLQELCTKRGITPQYDLVAIEGPVHEPTFIYRVTVGDLFANGQGSSKKKAKHAAAQNALDKISGVPESCPVGQIPTQNSQEHVAQDGIPGNPIGALQEFTMSRHWPPPLYELVQERGQPHEREFVISIKVCKFQENGTGRSKRLAKRAGAHKMLQLLQSLAPEQTEKALDEVEDSLLNVTLADSKEWYNGVKSGSVPTLTPQHSKQVATFTKNLKNNPGKTLQSLQQQKISAAGNFKPILQEIGIEQKFEIKYLDFEEFTTAGQHQCLVQLGTQPIAVMHGVGNTIDDAHEAAAHNALQYLKIIVKQ